MTTEVGLEASTMNRATFVIKYKNQPLTTHVPCAVCGVDIFPRENPNLFKNGTWDCVCLDCGRKYAPELADMLAQYWKAKDIEAEAATHRRDTCLDEQKTAELWEKSEPRYCVDVIARDFKGFKNVNFRLFHSNDMPDAEVAALVVFAKGRTIEDLTYPRSYIEQTFSEDEVGQLQEYFLLWDNLIVSVNRASAPDNHIMGVGAVAVGGGTDCYMFSKVEGYFLPFEAWGYFDLRQFDQDTETTVDA